MLAYVAKLTAAPATVTADDAAGIIEPLKDRLLELTKGDKSERAAAAAYLLLLNASGTEELTAVLAKSEDVHTRYVYLEYLMKQRPAESVDVFRRYFHDDLYALRLMSAAGLWRAFKTTGGGGEAAPEGEEGAAAEGGEASEGDGAE